MKSKRYNGPFGLMEGIALTRECRCVVVTSAALGDGQIRCWSQNSHFQSSRAASRMASRDR